MKVKDIVNKIRLVDTEIVIKEKFAIVKTSKVPMEECVYLERTVVSIQPSENKIEINIKPLD